MTEQPIVKRPIVARAASRLPALLGAAGALALGTAVFVGLDARRAAQAASYVPPTQPIDLPPAQPLPVAPTPVQVPAPQFTVNNSVSEPPRPPVMTQPMVSPTPEQAALRQRLSAPSLIVDFTQPEDAAVVGRAIRLAQMNPAIPGAAAGAIAGAAAAQSANPSINAPVGALENEAFGRRAPSDGPERVAAQRMGALDVTVPQGAVIEAVLETALDSDLPGYARAQVSRDVLSFDGANVLIPRGSRVIGQYKAATALGASRIFVIWQRIIRPDGVSIQLASPATDELGRAGLGGKVDRHFLQRFGGAILLSVLNGGIAAASAAATNGNSIYIGSATDATTAATSALKGSDIPPTIRTPQGASVRIFVARDLDFARVGPAR